jgi:sugar phosphate isomerase/epimerase
VRSSRPLPFRPHEHSNARPCVKRARIAEGAISYGLVAYSYRQALQSKSMTYEDLIRIAVDTGTDGIDMTVCWLPGTTDDVLLPIRRAAYRNRVRIYSVGTRVRLAQPAAELREKELVELRKWVDVAQKMGAHTCACSAARNPPTQRSNRQSDGHQTLKRGAEYAGARGIILGVEDDGITDYAKETIQLSPAPIRRGRG